MRQALRLARFFLHLAYDANLRHHLIAEILLQASHLPYS
jgi:hypothetical protein